MASPAAGRGRRGYFDPWPGYVDALTTLLMVLNAVERARWVRAFLSRPEPEAPLSPPVVRSPFLAIVAPAANIEPQIE